MNGSVRPEEAAGALADVRLRHEQAVRTAFMPVWYWWVGLLNIGLVAAVESRRPTVVGVGVASS
jgi:hypothetical protein